MPGLDVLVVANDGTAGWRTSSGELAASLTRAGASVLTVRGGAVAWARTFALTDLTQAWTARTAAARAIAEHDPEAVIYCAITAALLWPTPGPIWVDSIAAENRPGRHGFWQRPLERRRLAEAPFVLAMSPQSLAPLKRPSPETVVLPVPVERSGPIDGPRDVAAVAYAADPHKRRLEDLLGAWQRARRAGETLVVAGTGPRDPAEGVEFVGRLPPAEYRSVLRRAHVFVAAPRREDYGISALEALADGCRLVTMPAPGPYPALELARALDPRLVDEDLAVALRTALDDPRPDYAQSASLMLRPFSRAAVDAIVANDVLPRLVSRRR